MTMVESRLETPSSDLPSTPTPTEEVVKIIHPSSEEESIKNASVDANTELPLLQVTPTPVADQVSDTPAENENQLEKSAGVDAGNNTEPPSFEEPSETPPTDQVGDTTAENNNQQKKIKKRGGILKPKRTYTNNENHVKFKTEVEFIRPFDAERDTTMDIEIVEELKKAPPSYRELFKKMKEEEQKKLEEEEQKKREEEEQQKREEEEQQKREEEEQQKREEEEQQKREEEERKKDGEKHTTPDIVNKTEELQGDMQKNDLEKFEEQGEAKDKLGEKESTKQKLESNEDGNKIGEINGEFDEKPKEIKQEVKEVKLEVTKQLNKEERNNNLKEMAVTKVNPKEGRKDIAQDPQRILIDEPSQQGEKGFLHGTVARLIACE